QIDDRHPDFALMSTTDRGNGDVRHVSWICTGIFNDDGDRPMEIQTVGRDVTDLVTAEREVKESRRREREHERRLARVQRAALAQELTAGFGHQISQPLSSMAAHFGTCLHMLKSRHPDDEDIVRLIERGLKQVEVTGSMVKDYARLLRLPDQVPNELDMRQLVRGVVDLMEGYLCINNVTLDFMPGDQPLRVNGTELEIQQVLLNLVTNAVEAMQDSTGRRLEIRLGRRNGYVTCAIADSGPKLAKRDYEHMFEWFNTTKKDGLGMGLAVAKSIMERHGGKIKVRPNHPQGAIFTALIPDISAETPHVEHL
ncbi:MAG: ATP-binding protein, partial [Nisaea sp.]|uniref:sensor histidine kinase n=1 Tax=Nisaea sp. TaxID=2024842 RepID=UPI003267D02D